MGVIHPPNLPILTTKCFSIVQKQGSHIFRLSINTGNLKNSMNTSWQLLHVFPNMLGGSYRQDQWILVFLLRICVEVWGGGSIDKICMWLWGCGEDMTHGMGGIVPPIEREPSLPTHQSTWIQPSHLKQPNQPNSPSQQAHKPNTVHKTSINA